MRLVYVGLTLMSLTACGTDSSGPELLPGFEPGPPPQNGMQIILPIVRGLAPGSDNEMCTWTDKILDHDIDAKTLTAIQSAGAHHISVYTTTTKQPPGTTRTCTDDDMATFRFSAGSGGEGTGLVNEAPGDLVYRMHAGSQIVLNHHYINSTDKVIDAQSVLNVEFADPNSVRVPAGEMAIVDTNLNLPPGPSSVDISCTMKQDVKAWWAIPHMHAYGSHILYELVHNDTPQTLFDIAWDPSYMFQPPQIRKDPTAPMMIATGDRIHVHCDYNNTTPSSLTFGIEMCVGFISTVDDTNAGSLLCDAGDWGTF